MRKVASLRVPGHGASPHHDYAKATIAAMADSELNRRVKVGSHIVESSWRDY